MKELILSKLKEGSTWAGVGVLVSTLAIPHAAELGSLMPSVGVVVAGLLAIFFQ